MSKSKTTTSGVGLSGVVFIVFLILKLAQIGPVANWSWWWVTCPLWLPWGIVLSILLIYFLISDNIFK